MLYLLSYLFSPVGRFRRRDWNCVWLIPALINLSATLLFYALSLRRGWIAIGPDFRPVETGTMDSGMASIFSIVGTVWAIATFIAGIMSTIKRFHDHGNSGWKTAVFYFGPVLAVLTSILLAMFVGAAGWAVIGIFLIYMIWLLIKLGCLKGFNGDNHYGINPYSGDPAPPSVGLVMGMALILLGASVFGGYQVFMEYYTYIEKVKAEAAAEANKVVEAAKRAAAEAEERKNAHARTEKAAMSGDAEAQYNLAFAYTTGNDNVSKNEAEAFKWMLHAATQGHTAAQYNLGIFCLNGTGIPTGPDYRRAYFWLTRAAMSKYSSGSTTDYRAQAAAKLQQADIDNLNNILKTWQPVKETPPTAAPAPAPAPAQAPAIAPIVPPPASP